MTQGGADLADMPSPGATEADLRRFLASLPPLDERDVEARAARSGARSLSATAERRLLDVVIPLTDLTTLEATDTPERVRRLCAKAARPDPDDAHVSPVAAVCVYPDLVEVAVAALADTQVAVAAVAGAFPHGRATRTVKLTEVREVVAAGADELDVVIDRGAFLAGRYARVVDDIAAVKQACGDRRVKAILETGELPRLDDVRRAAWLALIGGAGFLKTSTGKITAGATPPAVLVMLEAAGAHAAATGRTVGVKASGGIRTAADAVRYLHLVEETVGRGWLTPERFRLGASGLVDDVVAVLRRSQLPR